MEKGPQGNNPTAVVKFQTLLNLNPLTNLSLCYCLSLSPCPPVYFSRWPLKGYSSAHRRRPLLRLHQRQLHRCKWKRIECYYWLPTKPTKPHSLARMSGLYTFIASTRHPSCHLFFTHPAKHIIHAYIHTWSTCVSLSAVSPFIHHLHEAVVSSSHLLDCSVLKKSKWRPCVAKSSTKMSCHVRLSFLDTTGC